MKDVWKRSEQPAGNKRGSVQRCQNSWQAVIARSCTMRKQRAWPRAVQPSELDLLGGGGWHGKEDAAAAPAMMLHLPRAWSLDPAGASAPTSREMPAAQSQHSVG